MASFLFSVGLKGLVTGLIDLDTDDIRVIWCCTANNALAVQDTAEFVTHVTLDEYNGTGYPGPSASGGAFATRIALDSEAVTAGSGLVKFDAADETTAAVSDNTAQGDVVGFLIYKHGASDAASRVIGYMDISTATGNGKQFTGSGGDIQAIWDAAGLIEFDAVV